MEEQDDAPMTSSKMDQQDDLQEAVDEVDYGVVNIKLPEQLQKISPSEEFVSVRHRWNTNEEIASFLIAFDRHKEWLVLPQKIRPPSGSMLLYNRKVVFYRRDGYCWKKRKNGSTIREDHMKLKVQGLECIYGSYVHSAILPTFHRRCYWLLQNPNIVLIHYLNVPYPEAAKPSLPSLSYELSQKSWNKEELVDQLMPMLSRAAQGTEHDTEDDQKVEKMLDEILPLLIPMQEGTKSVTTRPLAPAPTSTTSSSSSSSYLTSSSSLSSSSLKQPIRNQISTPIHSHARVLVQTSQPEPHLHPLQHLPDVNSQSPGKTATLQSPLLSNQILAGHAQPQQSQKIHVQIPAIHSFSNHCIQTTSNPAQPTSSSTQAFTMATELSHYTGQNLIPNEHSPICSTSPSFLTQTMASSAPGRIVTVGNSILRSLAMRSGEGTSSDACTSDFSIPIHPQGYPNSGNTASSSSSLPVTAYLADTLTVATSRNSGTIPSMASPSATINYLHNEDPSQQEQDLLHQIPYQTISQQNHSFVQQRRSDPQQEIRLQQSQQAAAAPAVLTLHLKPATGSSSSSSDMPGFVLSFQGAAIVPQPGEQSGFVSPGNASQPVSLTNGQGLVLIASQSPGGFVLNQISSSSSSSSLQSSVPAAAFVSTAGTSSVASTSNPLLSPFSHEHVSSTHFTSATSRMTGSAFSQPARLFAYSQSAAAAAAATINDDTKHELQPDDEHKFANIFPTGSSTMKPFPFKTSDFFHANLGDATFKDECSSDNKNETLNKPPNPLLFNSTHPENCVPAFGSTILRKEPYPTFSWAAGKNCVEPNSTFSSTSPLSCQAQNLIHQLSQQRQQEQSELMAGPSRNNETLKNMITTPVSCDTFDGSFSSLPSADLNLDDLLDLNDLDDVSDLGCSPFANSGLSEQPLGNAEMSVVGKDNSQENVVPYSCVSGTMVYQLAAPHQQYHHTSRPCPPHLSSSPPSSSGLHPGGGSYPPGSPHRGPLVCDNSGLSNSQGEPDSEMNSGLHPGGDPHPMSSYPPGSPHSGPLVCDNSGLSNSQEGPDSEMNSVIKDFSPDWAYTKTSTKILIAGPWSSKDSQYTCVFDGGHVQASLLQPGLLRCFTQNHRPGYVTLQVARDGVIISNCEVFEFCERECQNTSTTHPEWFTIDSNQLKLLLIERLDPLRQHFVNIQPLHQSCISDDMETLERNLVQQVQMMVSQPWTDSNVYPKAGPHNLTLLHLAASLGFAKLISCLIRWRMDCSCVALEFDVDAQSVDSHSCTPLMWACALGKIDAALTLYHWNTTPLKMCNKDGLLPLTIARQRGFFNLANQVEQLERAKEQQQLKEQQQHGTQHKNTATVHTMDFSPSTYSSNIHHPHGSATDLAAGPTDHDEQGKEDSELKDSLIEIRITPPPVFPKPGKPGPKLIRRFSEQAIGHQNKPLNKRNSVDLLPCGQEVDQVTLPSMGSPMSQPVCETDSEPQLPVSPDMAFVAPPAPRLLLEDEIDEPSAYSGESSTSKMDTDELVSAPSPIIDVERISSDEEVDANKDGTKHQMVTLANQIIAAIPERIKLSPSKADDVDDSSSGRGRSESHSSLPSQGSPRPSSFGDDSGISTPMTDSLAFEEYRYPEFGTPASSLSPDSTCLPSPYSPYSFTLDSPPPTTAEFTEYFNAPTTYMEKDFSQLTLSDQEQRKLYEAAKVIQNAYRHYRDKQQQQQQLQQQKEIEAAILIQSYYRRYKTYAYYKKMSHAAVLIQNQFRTYYAKRKKRGDTGTIARRELERLKKGRNQSVIIQQRFRSHYQRRSLDGKDENGLVQGSNDAVDSSPTLAQETSSQHQDETFPTDASAEALPDTAPSTSSQHSGQAANSSSEGNSNSKAADGSQSTSAAGGISETGFSCSRSVDSCGSHVDNLQGCVEFGVSHME